MNALTVIEPASNVDAYRASTDAATLCKEIVVASATTIQGRKYVCVEGWQAIAVAHGCTASARDVERIDGGVRAIGEIRRMHDGQVIATAEGFVGEDEPVWYGGRDARGKVHPRRLDYAIRAMAQTRAISRASRSAFAHVVVMMNAGLQTTPAEEVPAGGFEDASRQSERQAEPDRQPEGRRAQTGEHRQPDATPLSDEQRSMMMAMLERTGADARAFCQHFGVASVKMLPAARFEEAFGMLDRKARRAAEQRRAAPAATSPQHDDVLDDEIPY